jgi:hypothetical protein
MELTDPTAIMAWSGTLRHGPDIESPMSRIDVTQSPDRHRLAAFAA